MRYVHQSVVASMQVALTETNADGNNGIAIDPLSFVCERNRSLLMHYMTSRHTDGGCEKRGTGKEAVPKHGDGEEAEGRG